MTQISIIKHVRLLCRNGRSGKG